MTVQKSAVELPLETELFLLFSAFHVLLDSFQNFLACEQAHDSPVELANHCGVPFITTFALSPRQQRASVSSEGSTSPCDGCGSPFSSPITKKYRSFASFFCGCKSCKLTFRGLSQPFKNLHQSSIY